MHKTHPREAVWKELEKAFDARTAGLEGKARVCARRAAGWAAQSFLLKNGGSNIERSVLDALSELTYILPDDSQIRQRIAHLTMRVDKAYLLPESIDIIDDARQLISLLEEGSTTQ